MRLNSLFLPSYGALTETRLNLGPGLTVVYGLNEAGKSTLLSAYADLMCGFPTKTTLTHSVKRPQLRIQADVTMDDGSEFTMIRTSKRFPNDLLDASTSEPISTDVRQALTEGLSQSVLLRRYGLDHSRLVAGGRELMNGSGDLADIIFEARSGTDVRVLVDRLERRAGDLLGPRKNSAALLNRADVTREELDDELKKSIATAEAVESAQAQCSKAEEELERHRLNAARMRTNHSRLAQLEGSWPYWVQYRACREDLEQIEAGGPLLSSEDLRTAMSARERLGQINASVVEETAAAEDARRERAGLSVDEHLLAAHAAIDTLHAGKPDADNARARAKQHDGQISTERANLTEILQRLGLHDVAEPLSALMSIAVAEDRTADLNDLAGTKDDLDKDLDKAGHATREAADHLEEALRTPTDDSGLARNSDAPAELTAARQHREALWGYVSRSWLQGAEVPSEIASSTDGLADVYIQSINDADRAADELAGASAGHALISERRRALERAERRQTAVEDKLTEWQAAWNAATKSASLPVGLGTSGWRERAGLLSEASTVAEVTRKLERERAESINSAAQWDSAAAELAQNLGNRTDQPIAPENLPAWFDGIKAAYAESKSNQKADEIHRKKHARAVEEIEQLHTEQVHLDESLLALARAYNVDSFGLDELIERTKAHLQAAEALTQPGKQLKARHPDMTLEALAEELARHDREELSVAVTAAKEALDAADEGVTEAQEKAFEARNVVNELTARTGADELQQQLSEATANVLEYVEEYAVTRLMHHLLTKELRTYLDAHRNPVLDHAGTYLSRLTKGRYTGLRADGEGAERSLVVIGSDDADYETTELSEGTANQLYLALNLAGVLQVQRERRRDGQERIPIMLDDVLMAFDDERSASALGLLTEIGTEQQIVLFTHHEAVKEMAGATSGQPRVVTLATPASLD